MGFEIICIVVCSLHKRIFQTEQLSKEILKEKKQGSRYNNNNNNNLLLKVAVQLFSNVVQFNRMYNYSDRIIIISHTYNLEEGCSNQWSQDEA